MHKREDFSRSDCPIACGLDLIGDKWTLLVLRDMLLGKSRFGEFQESPEGIPSNILSARLRKLEEHGLIERVPLPDSKRSQYALTESGADLRSVIRAIMQWSNRHIDGTFVPPKGFLSK